METYNPTQTTFISSLSNNFLRHLLFPTHFHRRRGTTTNWIAVNLAMTFPWYLECLFPPRGLDDI